MPASPAYGSVLQVDPEAFKRLVDVNVARGVPHRAGRAAVDHRAARLRADRVVAGRLRRRARAGAVQRLQGRRSSSSPTRCGSRSPTTASTSARRTCRGSTPRWCATPRPTCPTLRRDAVASCPARSSKTTSVEKCGEAFVEGIEGRKTPGLLPRLGGCCCGGSSRCCRPGSARRRSVKVRARTAAADGRRGRGARPVDERPYRGAGEAVTRRLIADSRSLIVDHALACVQRHRVGARGEKPGSSAPRRRRHRRQRPIRPARSRRRPTSTASRWSTTTACSTPTSSTRRTRSTRAAGTRSTTPHGFTRRHDTAIQTPNSDTPYSAVGADLRTEPLVLTVPPIEQDRYYSLQFVDGYTYNFAYVGSRTTGNGGGKYLLAGPELEGREARGRRRGHPVATPTWRSCCTAPSCSGPSDLDDVKKIQAGYQVDAAVGVPEPAAAAARAGDRLRAAADPGPAAAPHRSSSRSSTSSCGSPRCCPTRQELRDRFAAIGIGPDGTFDADKLTPGDAHRDRRRHGRRLGRIRRLQEERDRHRQGRPPPASSAPAADLKGNYLYRMAGAVLGIYGNTAAEALYPSFVQRLRRCAADRRERLHLPVRAGPAAAGQRVLVADHVRAAAEPAGGQPDQPLPDQLADAAQPGPRRRRRLHPLRAARVAGPGQGVQLAARARGPVRRWCCGCTGRSPMR